MITYPYIHKYIIIYCHYPLLLLIIIHGPGPALPHVQGPRGRPSERPGGPSAEGGGAWPGPGP